VAVAVSPERKRGSIRRVLGRVVEWYFAEPRDEDADYLYIIGWWEVRRIPYNLLLVVVGIPSFILFLLFITAAGERGDPVEPIALMAAPFLYNSCYTAGWVCELLLRAIGVKNSAPTLMKLGTGLTVLLITFPAVAWGLVVLIQTFAG
jgi:hypothetical protein